VVPDGLQGRFCRFKSAFSNWFVSCNSGKLLESILDMLVFSCFDFPFVNDNGERRRYPSFFFRFRLLLRIASQRVHNQMIRVDAMVNVFMERFGRRYQAQIDPSAMRCHVLYFAGINSWVQSRETANPSFGFQYDYWRDKTTNRRHRYNMVFYYYKCR